MGGPCLTHRTPSFSSCPDEIFIFGRLCLFFLGVDWWMDNGRLGEHWMDRTGQDTTGDRCLGSVYIGAQQLPRGCPLALALSHGIML